MGITEFKIKGSGRDEPSTIAYRSFLDASQRALVGLEGADAQDLLQRLSTNDVSRLTVGDTLQTILTNEKGRIIEVLSVHKLAAQRLCLVGQSTDGERLARWLDKFIIMEDAKVTALNPVHVHYMLYDSISLEEARRSIAVPKETLVWEEHWGDSRIVHLLANRSDRDQLVGELRRAGASPADSEEFENFRISHGIPASPNELSDLYNPLEAGLDALVSWTKGCYIGQEVIARLDTYKKVQRRLARLLLDARPRSLPQAILAANGEIGTITSVGGADKEPGIPALGYVKVSVPDANEGLFFSDGERRISVHVQKGGGSSVS